MLKLDERLQGDSYCRHFEQGPDSGTMIINMGPQHPSTHGVLRIICELEGEYIRRAEPVLGYIHRMHEKMGETKSWWQFLPNMGRTDYLHAMGWGHTYVLAVERLAEIEVPERAEYLRVIATELNRISSHLLWWGAYLLDLGAFTPIMYAFADREIILDLLQEPTGSRLTYCYHRFGGVKADVSEAFVQGVRDFIRYERERFPMYRDLVTENIILRKRVEGIGIIDKDMCRRYGATGPVCRGSGIDYDCRRDEPYSIYDRFDFRIPVEHGCDAMARYLVRMEEMEQSMRIIEQALDQLPGADGKHISKKAPKPNFKAPAGECYAATEGARGKIGIYVASDGSKTPYRIKLRAPGYCNLSLFAELATGTMLADAVSILGSLDLVIPEIDR
ncbi:NADH-quinone oxidoreductase subunit D [Desulfobaculum xiamenense]|uniref:NADH-quinone oxidoreductase subunit D n=1 Tax=Desulfobaculum xiamenense TaxID=995050 RepID=A0A846QHD6_9BACT|nr:NADH-quinone oxidoreductase subunit D [Desulfobaculum xiamenense]NJB67688.1 NADH-quinone oxidoreductase subunit D [Desulfobaculum xiamenense]